MAPLKHSDQTDIFRRDEGNNWFLRNRDHLFVDHSGDVPLTMVERWARDGGSLDSICELGCANGWRLAALRQAYPNTQRLVGSDISEVAIADGRRAWPSLELAVGSLDEPGVIGHFNLVIVSFVFHWVARRRLARSVAMVDELITDGGALILADFFPDQPCACTYHHRSDLELFTYKQNYAECFLGLGFYEQVDELMYSHSGASGTINSQDRAICTLLRKDFALYERFKCAGS